MSIDKMREEFEFAIRNNGFFHDATEAAKDAYLERGSNGQYRSLQVNGAWWGWQASRESLVVELPDDGIEDCQKEWPERGAKYEYDTFDTGYLFACMKHEQAIEAAGLKVKSC
jgi:hypothetical protein